MHLVAGILGAIGTIVYLIIRANQAARAVQELGAVASDTKSFWRRSRWKSKAHVDQIRAIKDPRLSAAVMMCALAKSDGDLSEREATVIRDQLKGPLGISETDADEVLTQARWLTRDTQELSTTLRRASPPVQASCTAEEKGELMDMLTTVAEADRSIDALQQDALDRLRREFGLARP